MRGVGNAKVRNMHEAVKCGLLPLLLLSAVPLVQGQQHSNESATCDSYLNQGVPKFHVERKFRTDLRPGLVLFVSVAPSDIHRERLLILSCPLGRKHAAESALYVWIFDSRAGGQRYNSGGEGNDEETTRSRRGLYGFSREGGKGNQSLDWWPDRSAQDRLVHVDLGEPPKSHQ
jgi:hypothetical protein